MYIMNDSINPAPFHQVEVLSSSISANLMLTIITYCNTLLTEIATIDLPYRHGAKMNLTFDAIEELTAILAAAEAGLNGHETRFSISASNLAAILKILILREDRDIRSIRECIELIRHCK
jgi:hypothetical protein